MIAILTTSNWIYIGAAALLLLLAAYIFMMLEWYCNVIESKKIDPNENPIEADQIYFLPKANILITATAKIAVTKKADDSTTIVKAEIYEMSFENQVQLEADEDQMFSVHYKSSWINSDDIRLGTSALGLLESIAVTAEDRFAQTLSQITDFPKKINEKEKTTALLPEQPIAQTATTVTNLIPVTKSFMLYTDELHVRDSIPFKWKISIEGNYPGMGGNIVDASFLVKVPKPLKSPVTVAADKPTKGIVTRPLGKLSLNFHLNSSGNSNGIFDSKPSLTYQAMVPDTSKLLLVSFKRRLFSKYVQSQKFTSGMLIENYINKPSEAENLIAIPINIAKAIVSIPAQLLTFKITKIQQQTSFETEMQKLIAAKLLREKGNATLPAKK